MTIFIKVKRKKSNGQTNIDKYMLALWTNGPTLIYKILKNFNNAMTTSHLIARRLLKCFFLFTVLSLKYALPRAMEFPILQKTKRVNLPEKQ